MAKTIPDSYPTVTSWLICKDTARVHNEYGSIRPRRGGDRQCRRDDVRRRLEWPDTPGFLRLYVEDADVVYRQALAAGASSVTEPTELFWGELVGRVRDPLGNVWWIQQRLFERDPEQMVRRASQPEFVEAMKYAQIVLPAHG